MKGLMLKEILSFKSAGKLYLLICAVWFFSAVATKNSDVFPAMACMFNVLIPLTSIGYDEKNQWDKFAITMPISRQSIVVSKYLLGWGVGVLNLIISVICSVMVSDNLLEKLPLHLVFFSAGVCLSSIMMPIVLKFGTEKARSIIFIVAVSPMLIGLLLKVAHVPFLDVANPEILAIIFPIFAVLLIIASFFASLSIYKKKEF